MSTNLKNKLKCPFCGEELHLSIGFDGCDWETVAGDKSGFKYPLLLNCEKQGCGHVFTLGRLNNMDSFSEVIEELRPYSGKLND